jgi:hypothetical protein
MPSPEPSTFQQSDVERYHRVSRPHASKEAAQAAWMGFLHDLNDLREKWKIPEVLTVAIVNFTDPNGNPRQLTGDIQYGDSRTRPRLVLHLYRQESEMLQALIEWIST